MIKKIPKLENCWLAKTDPKDVARVESKTVICTESENETIPTPADGVEGKYLSYNVPFQGYLMVSGCDRFLAPLRRTLKNGGVSDDAESADSNFTSGHKFSSRPLRILSEYHIVTFYDVFRDVTVSDNNPQIKVNWANGFLQAIYKAPLTVGSLDV